MRRFLAERNRSTHARGESRTRTGLPPPAPKAGASAVSPPGRRLALRRADPLPVALLGEQALGKVQSFLDLAQPTLDVGRLAEPALRVFQLAEPPLYVLERPTEIASRYLAAAQAIAIREPAPQPSPERAGQRGGYDDEAYADRPFGDAPHRSASLRASLGPPEPRPFGDVAGARRARAERPANLRSGIPELTWSGCVSGGVAAALCPAPARGQRHNHRATAGLLHRRVAHWARPHQRGADHRGRRGFTRRGADTRLVAGHRPPQRPLGRARIAFDLPFDYAAKRCAGTSGATAEYANGAPWWSDRCASPGPAPTLARPSAPPSTPGRTNISRSRSGWVSCSRACALRCATRRARRVSRRSPCSRSASCGWTSNAAGCSSQSARCISPRSSTSCSLRWCATW